MSLKIVLFICGLFLEVTTDISLKAFCTVRVRKLIVLPDFVIVSCSTLMIEFLNLQILSDCLLACCKTTIGT